MGSVPAGRPHPGDRCPSMATSRRPSPAPTAMSISAGRGGPEPPCSTSSRVNTSLTGRRHFCARRTATASPWMAILPPKPPPISSGTTLSFDAGRPSMRGDHQLGGELPLGGGPHRGKAVGIDLRHHRPAARDSLGARCRPARSGARSRAPSASAAAHRRARSRVREQTLLGARGRGSTPLVKTCSCSTGASAAMARRISSTAASGS